MSSRQNISPNAEEERAGSKQAAPLSKMANAFSLPFPAPPKTMEDSPSLSVPRLQHQTCKWALHLPSAGGWHRAGLDCPPDEFPMPCCSAMALPRSSGAGERTPRAGCWSERVPSQANTKPGQTSTSIQGSLWGTGRDPSSPGAHPSEPAAGQCQDQTEAAAAWAPCSLSTCVNTPLHPCHTRPPQAHPLHAHIPLQAPPRWLQ